MAWFGDGLPSLSNLKGQLTNFTKEVLSEGIIEEIDERSVALKEANQKCVELQEILNSKDAEVSLLRRQNCELQKTVVELKAKPKESVLKFLLGVHLPAGNLHHAAIGRSIQYRVPEDGIREACERSFACKHDTSVTRCVRIVQPSSIVRMHSRLSSVSGLIELQRTVVHASTRIFPLRCVLNEQVDAPGVLM